MHDANTQTQNPMSNVPYSNSYVTSNSRRNRFVNPFNPRTRRPRRLPQSQRRARRNNIFWRRLRNKVSRPFSNTEVKQVDVTATATPGTTQSLVLLNALSQGTTRVTRIGNSVRFVALACNFKMNMNSSATHTTIRLLILYDKQSNGAAPANIYQSSSIISPFNPDNMYRYEILSQSSTSLSISGMQERVVSFSIPLYHITRYQSNNGDITDITTGSLYFGLVSDDNTNTPTVEYYFRASFVDD